MEYRILKMEEAHIKGVSEIEKECFSSPWSENCIRSETVNPNARFFVALSEDKVVGYAGMHTVCGECYIANVAVSEAYRRLGIASALLGRLEETARSEDCEFITLEVRKSNLNAIGLYSRLGYKQVGVRKNFYSKPTEDAVLMTKAFEV